MDVKLKLKVSHDTDLVDGVVSEVDVVVSQILHLVGVGPGGEPHEAVLVDVEFQRVHAGQKDVDPQVKLETIDEHRVSDVSLDNCVADPVRNLLERLCKDNSIALGSPRRFADPQTLIVVLLDFDLH